MFKQYCGLFSQIEFFKKKIKYSLANYTYFLIPFSMPIILTEKKDRWKLLLNKHINGDLSKLHEETDFSSL